MQYSLDDLGVAENEVNRAFAAWGARGTPDSPELLQALQSARGRAIRIRRALLSTGQLAPTKDDLIQTVLDDMYPRSRPGSVVSFDDRTYVLEEFPASRANQTVLESTRMWFEQPSPATRGGSEGT
jgi:hypothetical protein